MFTSAPPRRVPPKPPPAQTWKKISYLSHWTWTKMGKGVHWLMTYLNVEEAILSPSELSQHPPIHAYHRFSYHQRTYKRLNKSENRKRKQIVLMAVSRSATHGEIAHRYRSDVITRANTYSHFVPSRLSLDSVLSEIHSHNMITNTTLPLLLPPPNNSNILSSRLPDHFSYWDAMMERRHLPWLNNNSVQQ